MELLVPLKFGSVLDSAIDKDSSVVIHIIIMVIVLFFTMAILGYLKSLLYIYISNDTSKIMKNHIVAQLLNLPAEKIDEYKNGELFSRFEDVDKVVSFLLEVLNGTILNCCIIVFLIGILLKISMPLAIFHFCSVPLLIMISNRYSKVAKDIESKLVSERDKHYNFLFGLIQGIREVKSLGMIKNVRKVFENNHDSFVNREMSQGKISALWEGGYDLLAVFFQIVVLLISCGQIILGKLTVGMYYTFNSYASRFSALVQELIRFQTQFMVVMVSVDKIMCLLQEDSQRLCKSRKEKISNPIETIEARNLKFRYRGMEEDTIKKISFRFSSPSIHILVGHNGSGKSTLLNMIMGYYTSDEGDILINDVTLKKIGTENLYKNIVYIRQNPFFFNMSILENFKLLDEKIGLDDVVRVCQVVGVHEYIMSLPEQYDTEMGETGNHFSGGQIQCLALARGLILDADVYLLDEVTSDLDGEKELRIMKLLRSLDKIVILVTHRLSEIESSDHILVLDKGRIIEDGKHEELIKTCQIYQRLCNMLLE